MALMNRPKNPGSAPRKPKDLIVATSQEGTGYMGGAATLYEYGVAKNPEFNKYGVRVRIRRPDGTVSEWDNALMGHYDSRQRALESFRDRYKSDSISGLKPLNPTVAKAKAARLADEAFREKKVLEARETQEAEYQIGATRREEIKDAVAKAKFKSETTPIIGRTSGAVLHDEKGPSIGGLTILKHGTPKRPNWGITHQASGLRVTNKGFSSLGEAKVAAYRLSKLADFRQSKDQLEAIRRSLPLALGKLENDVYAAL
jgi:hypothetical protein